MVGGSYPNRYDVSVYDAWGGKINDNIYLSLVKILSMLKSETF